MNVTRKDAAITNTGADEDFPGTFRVVLSAPTKDRDGDTLLPEDWKLPLPDHITFDQDHGMSVATTVGSGKPTIDPDTGELIVEGTYSSLPRAQEVRTLVNEGHIRTTSVAFMNERLPQKDGKSRTVRELLNGAFVAIPSNREALVLNSKSADVTEAKTGARNSAADAEKIQHIHDAAAALGADCAGAKGLGRKDAVEADDPGDDPAALAQAVDAALDEALEVLGQLDLGSLPPEVAQAIALVQAADAAIDELLEVAGLPDPDEDDAPDAGAVPAPVAGAEKSAPAAGAKAAPAEEVDSESVDALAVALLSAAFTGTD